MPETKPHQYGDPVEQAPGQHVAACSRCGATRVEVIDAHHPQGGYVGYRLMPDGFAFGTELPCTPVDRLLALARGSAGPEAQTAAVKAWTLVQEHELVWHPEPVVLATALAQARAATSEASLRTAVLGVAQASAGCVLMRDAERRALRKKAASRPAPAAKPDISQRVKSAAGEASRFFSDLFQTFAGNVEVADGVTASDVAESVKGAYSELEQEVQAFRREYRGEPVAGQPRGKPKSSPAARASKPKKAAPRKTRAPSASSKRRARSTSPKKRGSR